MTLLLLIYWWNWYVLSINQTPLVTPQYLGLALTNHLVLKRGSSSSTAPPWTPTAGFSPHFRLSSHALTWWSHVYSFLCTHLRGKAICKPSPNIYSQSHIPIPSLLSFLFQFIILFIHCWNYFTLSLLKYYLILSLDASTSSVSCPGVHLHRATEQESWVASCKSWSGFSCTEDFIPTVRLPNCWSCPYLKSTWTTWETRRNF